MFPLLQITLCIIIGSIYTLFYAWQIFLLVLVLAILLVTILSKLFSRIGRAYDEKQDKIAKQKNLFMECFMCSDIIKINMLINPIFVIHKIVSGDKAKAEVNLMKEKTWANIFMENGILMIEMLLIQRTLATTWQMLPSRPRSRLMDVCSGTKLATARLSAACVRYVPTTSNGSCRNICQAMSGCASTPIHTLRTEHFTDISPTSTKSSYHLKNTLSL